MGHCSNTVKETAWVGGQGGKKRGFCERFERDQVITYY